MNTSRRAFTLVEVMIAIMIIGLLAAMAAPAVLKAREKAQTRLCMNNLRVIHTAGEQYLFEHPDDTDITLEELKQFFSNEVIPECPQGGTYQTKVDKGFHVTCTIDGHEL